LLSGRSGALPRPFAERSLFEADHQARALRARLREVGDVAAVEDVEHAVGEDHRPRQLGQARQQLGARAQLGDEIGSTRDCRRAEATPQDA
jgi:hypothetical protein